MRRVRALTLAAMVGLVPALMVRAESKVDLRPPSTASATGLARFYGTSHGGETQCGQCHVPSGWLEVKFPHDRTGFALGGAHAKLACRSCHASGFEAPIGSSCRNCHRDPHAGVLGALCDRCHNDQSWRTTFSVEAHQLGGFPLTGPHAALPCEECHLDARDRTFAATANVRCEKCHLNDYLRASIASRSHQSLGFGTDCVSCHSAGSFTSGKFPGHDRCFFITGGPHASVPCVQCHSTLAGAMASGKCQTNSETCVSCHEHQCGTTDRHHRNVPGYACADRKCYECHKFAEP